MDERSSEADYVGKRVRALFADLSGGLIRITGIYDGNRTSQDSGIIYAHFSEAIFERTGNLLPLEKVRFPESNLVQMNLDFKK